MWLFKSKKDIILTPKLCFAVSLLYMATIDDNLGNNEITYLSTVMHGDTKTIQEANKYIEKATKKGKTFDEFLMESNNILSEEQKETIIINLIDIMFADGEASEDEEKLLLYIVDKYNFDLSKYKSYKEIMIKKNSYNTFK